MLLSMGSATLTVRADQTVRAGPAVLGPSGRQASRSRHRRGVTPRLAVGPERARRLSHPRVKGFHPRSAGSLTPTLQDWTSVSARHPTCEVRRPVDATQPLNIASGTTSMAVASAVREGNEVRSVDRAASLLIALGEADGEVGVTELARRLGLHKSTASRLLATLLKWGLVQRDEESSKYLLGLAVVRLGGHAEKTLDLRSIAMPELEALARSVKETTTLGVLDGNSVVTIAWADASGMGHERTVGNLPQHATATGKVLL